MSVGFTKVRNKLVYVENDSLMLLHLFRNPYHPNFVLIFHFLHPLHHKIVLRIYFYLKNVFNFLSECSVKKRNK